MRTSEGAFAYIVQPATGCVGEYLLQWNPSWGAFNFVGGRVESGESYRDCCVREINEELAIQEHVGYEVALQPLAHVEYTSYSDSAMQETAYIFELYEAQLSEAATALVTGDEQNLWVSPGEIHAGVTRDGRRISRTVSQILSRAGLLGEPTANGARQGGMS